MNSSHCSEPSSGYQYVLFPLVYSVALVIGLPGNLVALFVFIFKVIPRTSSSVYIINLALADTAILLTLPFRIHYHLNRNRWIFGDMACCVNGTLWYANVYISICFMTCICVDRYVAVVHPHRYLRLKNPRNAVVVSVLLWVILGVSILTFILMGPLESTPVRPSGGNCFENFAKEEWNGRMGFYSVLILVFCSLLPSIIILVCYPLAMRRISSIQGRTSHRARRIILTVLAITLFCFLPYHVVHLLHLLRRLEVIDPDDCSIVDGIYHARRVTLALVSLNTCLDPLLYYVTSKHCNWNPLRGLWSWCRARRAVGVYTLSHAVDLR